MRLALCNEVLRPMALAQQADFAAAVGYDALEIAPFTLSDEPHRLTSEERRAIARTVADAGLSITSLHWLLVVPEGLSITDPDADVRTRTSNVISALCQLAADLGAGVLVHGSPKQRSIGHPDAANWTMEAFAAAARAAEAAGVTYCIEPLARNETDNINTLAEAAAVVDAIASPHLRTMLDTSAAGQTEAEPIEVLVARHVPIGHIAHCQVNDPNRRGPGEGDMLFAPILAALRTAGYRGDIAVEPFIYKPDGPACAARAAGYMRALMEAV